MLLNEVLTEPLVVIRVVKKVVIYQFTAKMRSFSGNNTFKLDQVLWLLK